MDLSDDLGIVQPRDYVDDDPLQVVRVNGQLRLRNVIAFPERRDVLCDLGRAALVDPLKFTHRRLQSIKFSQFTERAFKTLPLKRAD